MDNATGSDGLHSHLACVCTYVISIVSVYLFAASGAFCTNTNALHNIMACMSSI